MRLGETRHHCGNEGNICKQKSKHEKVIFMFLKQNKRTFPWDLLSKGMDGSKGCDRNQSDGFSLYPTNLQLT